MVDADQPINVQGAIVSAPKIRISRRISGQSTIEFTCAMTVVLILIYALVMVFRWAGLDLAERRFAHQELLTTTNEVIINPVTNAVTTRILKAENQLNPDFYKPRKIDAVFRGFDLKR